MPILEQNFNQETLELIAMDSLAESSFMPNQGHYFRMAVYDNDDNLIKQYYSNKTFDGKLIHWSDSYTAYYDVTIDGTTNYSNPVQLGDIELPIYYAVVDGVGKYYLKPNDTLSKDPQMDYESGQYKIKFDVINNVMADIFSVPEPDTAGMYNWPYFYIIEISTSRKEIRLLLRNGDNNQLYFEDTLENNNTFSQDFLSRYGIPNHPTPELDYKMNLLMGMGDEPLNIPILNYVFDNVSMDRESFIVKLSEQLPLKYKKQDKIEILKEIYPTQFENILYVADSPDDIFANPLGYVSELINTDTLNGDNLQSYNQLINSSSMTNTQQQSVLNTVFSSSKNLNIDYNDYENHVFFGSAELKFKNFINKIKNIENYLYEISSSLVYDDNSQVTEIRKNAFNKINDIVSNFSDYERWMYTDYHTTSSYPNIGKNYTYNPPLTGSFNDVYSGMDNNIQVLNNHNGLDTVYKVSSIGDDVVISGSFTDGGSGATAGGTNYDAWYTGSTNTSWFISESRAHFDWYGAGGDVQLRQYKDSSGNLLTHASRDQSEMFSVNKSYLVEFDVTTFETSGDTTVTFQLGDNNPGTLAKHDFTIDSTGHYSNIININQPIEETKNYLVIEAPGALGFSGSIDNVTIKDTKDQDGRIDIFTDKYRVENWPFSNYSGSFYLSFLAKWPADAGFPTWENYNVTQSTAGYNAIPDEAFYSQSILQPAMTASEYRRYVYAASQSYWRYAEGLDTNVLTGDEGTGTAYDSTQWEILNGSNITGSYGMPIAYANDWYDDIITYGSASMLPSGELFRMYYLTGSENNQPITSSYFTDIKVFRDDYRFKHKPEEILDFSHIYKTDSTLVENWYTASLSKAKEFDEYNINALSKNIPRYIKNSDDNNILIPFLSMIGEHYDLIKSYIDNYIKLQSRNYNRYEIPNELITDVGNNYGWNFINTDSTRNLLQEYFGNVGDGTYKDLTTSIWKNILNNLIYIYKTKGTENAVRSLLNCFGLPPETFSVYEISNYQARMHEASPGEIKLHGSGPLSSQQGDRNYLEETKPFKFLNFNQQNFQWSASFNTSTGYTKPDKDTVGFRFAFTSMTGSGDAILLQRSSSIVDSGSAWDLRLKTHGSSDYSASLEFRLKSTEYISGSYGNPTLTVSASTDVFPIKSQANDKVWYAGLQRKSINNVTGSTYEIFLAHRDFNKSDEIKYFSSASVSTDINQATTNYTSSYSDVFPTGSRKELWIGSSLTGSITEISAWKYPIDKESFLMYAYDPSILRASSMTSSLEDVIWRYNFGGNYVNPNSETIIQDLVPYDNPYNQKLDQCFSSPTFRRIDIPIVKFSTIGFGDNDRYNNQTSTVPDEPTFTSNILSPVRSVIAEDNLTRKNRNQRRTNTIKLGTKSPTQQLNEYIDSHLADYDIKEIFADNLSEYSSSYVDNDDIREKIFKQLGSKTPFKNVNDWILENEKLIPNQITNIIENVVPANVKVEDEITISSDKLKRNKFTWGRNIGNANLNYHTSSLYNIDEVMDLVGRESLVISNNDIDLFDYTLENSKYIDVHKADIFNLDETISLNPKYVENTSFIIELLDSIDLDRSYTIESITSKIDIDEILDIKNEAELIASFKTVIQHELLKDDYKIDSIFVESISDKIHYLDEINFKSIFTQPIETLVDGIVQTWNFDNFKLISTIHGIVNWGDEIKLDNVQIVESILSNLDIGSIFDNSTDNSRFIELIKSNVKIPTINDENFVSKLQESITDSISIQDYKTISDVKFISSISDTVYIQDNTYSILSKIKEFEKVDIDFDSLQTFKSIFNSFSKASILKEDYFKDYMYSDLSENVSDIINLLENNYNLSSQFINQNKASIEYILNDYNFTSKYNQVKKGDILVSTKNGIKSYGQFFDDSLSSLYSPTSEFELDVDFVLDGFYSDLTEYIQTSESIGIVDYYDDLASKVALLEPHTTYLNEDRIKLFEENSTYKVIEPIGQSLLLTTGSKNSIQLSRNQHVFSSKHIDNPTYKVQNAVFTQGDISSSYEGSVSSRQIGTATFSDPFTFVINDFVNKKGRYYKYDSDTEVSMLQTNTFESASTAGYRDRHKFVSRHYGDTEQIKLKNKQVFAKVYTEDYPEFGYIDPYTLYWSEKNYSHDNRHIFHYQNIDRYECQEMSVNWGSSSLYPNGLVDTGSHPYMGTKHHPCINGRTAFITTGSDSGDIKYPANHYLKAGAGMTNMGPKMKRLWWETNPYHQCNEVVEYDFDGKIVNHVSCSQWYDPCCSGGTSEDACEQNFSVGCINWPEAVKVLPVGRQEGSTNQTRLKVVKKNRNKN